MRLKTYTAPTTAEAMAIVRRELGDQAIIVSTQKDADGRGARVTAALENAPEPLLDAAEAPAEPVNVTETVRQALGYHGTPPRLAERLAATAGALDVADATLAFAGAVDAGFSFRPLPEVEIGRPTMLVGPPGGGKTVTTAKLAARATIAGHRIGVVTTDTYRAGGFDQLAAFTRIMKIDLKSVSGPEALETIVRGFDPGIPIYVDTQGVNPFDAGEMAALRALIAAAAAEPVLVLAAGGDAMEMAETASAFAALGANRLVVTRLDMARRLGGLLAAADAARMTIADVGITPHVAGGLATINPVSLARMILPHTADETSSAKTKAPS